MKANKDPGEWNSVAVLGCGREGRAAMDYLTRRAGLAPEKIAVLDTGMAERPADLDPRILFRGGAGAFEGLSDYDAIVKSPGIPPSAFPDATDYERSVTLAQMFFDLAPERVIAVSGTKGKSTLATLLSRVIADAGYSCAFYGNIGTPVLPAYDPEHPADYIVIELSSYMLDRLEKRNFASVLVNIFPDHLDWHGGFEKYALAKMRLLKWSEFALVGAQAAEAGYLETYRRAFGELPPYEVFGNAWKYAYRDGWWYRDDEALFSSENMKLIGRHIFENFASVIALADRIGIPLESVRRTFEAFEWLPHRLRHVATVGEVEYWDDAISTTPESTMASMAAVAASGRRIATMMLGGLDRGYDYRALGEALASYGVRRCVLFPDAGEAIKKHLPESMEMLETRDMEEAVRWAASGGPGVCLLSTAAPSYSIWKNFEEKGDRFMEAISHLPR